MPGSDNNIQYSGGYRIEPSSAESIQLMQKTANDVSCINYSGNPEGAVAANISSILHDRSTGNLYRKNTGTGNTGWQLIGNTSSGSGTQFHIPRYADSTGKLLEDSNWQVNAAFQMVSPNLLGVPSSPDLALQGTNTGFYSPSAAAVSLSLGGTLYSQWDTNGYQHNAQVRSFPTDGNASSASLTFIAQHNLTGGAAGADGVGARWRTNVPDDSGATRAAADMIMEYQEAATATRKGRFRFYCDLAGSLTETFNTGLYQSQFFSGVAFKRTATAISYNVLVNDYLVAVTDTSAARTITLPAPGAAGMVTGQEFVIKDESIAAATNNITINVSGGALIDGLASQLINTNGGSIKVYSNGSNYFII